MRYEIMLHQISPERLRTMRDPMKTMQLCQGMCKSVPDEVCDAVFDSLKQVPGVNGNANERDTGAQIIAECKADGHRYGVEGIRWEPTSEHPEGRLILVLEGSVHWSADCDKQVVAANENISFN